MKPNPFNPKAVTRKRMEDAGADKPSTLVPAAPPPPGGRTMTQSEFGKAAPVDKRKRDAGLAAALKKRGG